MRVGGGGELGGGGGGGRGGGEGGEVRLGSIVIVGSVVAQ